jgi:hypothetical protein
MNSMKKRILSTALILMILVGLSANNPPQTTFTIGTFIGELAGLIVHDVTQSDPSSIDDWASLNPIGTSGDPVWLGTDSEGGNQPSYRNVALSVMINTAGNYTVESTMGPMTSPNGGKIGYTVALNGVQNPIEIESGDPSGTFTMLSISDVTGLTFTTQKFTVTMDADDSESAIAGTYSSTWTINLIKQ